ncbi:hypothetical protein [Jannaschia aquimarina]|uniref:Uncharacterized protein n=1 Tax=Jannaschia aquimarina TaxID=935700 RepID=A0A0D1EA16_9RHOB|nr:hypothetical protein [Jannaschia aquimarina]KIT14529.1 hypothetical protein jaqu_38190 [Jannaschia aquimarina]SNT35650.1 hypothetical protein SAMN05421775_112133 [Jannaschia aquimarina]
MPYTIKVPAAMLAMLLATLMMLPDTHSARATGDDSLRTNVSTK